MLVLFSFFNLPAFCCIAAAAAAAAATSSIEQTQVKR
jgi:hypothetical protein